MNHHHLMRVLIWLATALAGAAPARAASLVLLNDNFDAATANTTDLNVDLARQTGAVAPVTYTMALGPSQCCGHQLQSSNAPDQLLLANGGFSTSSLDYNFNGTNSPTGLRISFDVDPLPALYGSTDLSEWGCINLGMAAADQLVNVNDSPIHFGVLFRADGRLQAFDGAAIVNPAPEPVYTIFPGGLHHIDLLLTDTDGNPFDGVGNTYIEVFADHHPRPVFAFAKAGGYANNYINLQGFDRSHFDNLEIARLPPGQTPALANPSFEADTFTVWPGYVGGNGPITGWNALSGHGVNPGTFGGPFTDNGAIPDGSRAAFLQEAGPLSQAVSGFIIGAIYQVRYFENARACCSGFLPFTEVKVAGQTIVAAHPVAPVGDGNPYHEVLSDPFIATATTLELAFVKSSPQGGDNTALIDRIDIFQTPVISRQPKGGTSLLGASVTFTAAAFGSSLLVYQWQLNGIDIPGATGASYTISSATVTNGGTYTVRVANAFGAVASAPAVLVFSNVENAPSPSDDFAGALTLAGPGGRLRGSTCGATKEAGEPNHAGKPGGSSVWYNWTAPATGIATFYTSGSTFDTLLAVYTGTDLNQLTPVANDDDRGGFFTSKVQFNARSGVEYHIAIDGIGGSCGTFVLSYDLEVTDATLPEITMQPRSQTVPFGALAMFRVVAVNSDGHFQWFHNGTPIAGATDDGLALPAVQIADLGAYAVRVSNGPGRFQDSDLAFLEVGPDPCVRTRDKAEDLFLPNGLCGNDPPGGGAGGAGFAAAAAVSFGGFSVTAGTIISQHFSTVPNTAASGEINGCAIAGGASAWCTITNRASEGLLTIDTMGSQIDTVMEVWQWTESSAAWAPLECNNDAIPGINLQSRVRFHTQPPALYRVYVDGVGGEGGHVRFNIHQGLTLLAESTFDRTTDGWVPAPSTSASFQPALRAGGYLRGAGRTALDWHWQAPPNFLGDKSAAFGGVLEFDLRQSAGSPILGQDDLRLTGGGLTLTQQLLDGPGTNWTYHHISLCPTAWQNPTTGRSATQSEMLRVLTSLSRLEIRGQYSPGSQMNDLDDVALFGPERPLPRLIISQVNSPGGPKVVIQWGATAAAFLLEAANTPATSAWQIQSTPLTVVNGLNTVTIARTGVQQFFRLRRAGCVLP